MELKQKLSTQMHDLMNQMSVLLLQIDLGDRVKDQHALQKSSRQLFEGLKEMQMLLRLHLDRLKINRLDQPLCNAPQDALGRHEVLIEAAGIETEVHCDPDIVALYDALLVSTVISSAVFRALNSKAKRMVLHAEPSDGGYLFSVEDDGVLHGDDHVPIAEDERVDVLIGREVARGHSRGERQGRFSVGQSEQLGGNHITLWIP